jgi:Family of unknown function (DUF6481)
MAKAALLEKFRAASRTDDPQRKSRDQARRKIVEARKARAAERDRRRSPRRSLARRSELLPSNARQVRLWREPFWNRLKRGQE